MRLYFCTDLHASTRCWKKFLAAAKFYDAQYVIVGGDITGKFVVPIVTGPKGVRKAHFLGVERRISTDEELKQLKSAIADAGQYAFETTPDEESWYAGDQTRIDGLFQELAMERVREWVAEAEDKLADSGVRVFVSAANDDFLEVDDALAESTLIEDPNGTVIDLDDGIQIMGMGWGNETPWACPRDIPESELTERIDTIANTLSDPGRTVFNIHVPPMGSGLDVAPRLDDDLRPVVTASGSDLISVGSTATHDALIKYKPLLGLHGHIHESKGITDVEGVPVANPGSEYGEGILDGLVIDIDRRNGVQNIQLVAG